MGRSTLVNELKRHRQAAGLTQERLARRVGVTRQAIVAAETGRSVPSTRLGLELARALGRRVEDLFRLESEATLEARVPDAPAPGARVPARVVVVLGRVDGRWAAHPVYPDGARAADGVVVAGDGQRATVRPTASVERLERNVLVAGCAPLLGALAQRVNRWAPDASMTWLQVGNDRALDLLARGSVHLAGIHGSWDETDLGAAQRARRALPGRRLLLAHLTRWRLGLTVAAGNPLAVADALDLVRPGLRVAHREEGSGAQALVRRLLAARGARIPPAGTPAASDHREVARLVRLGKADAGVAIEAAALAEGLDFVPLAEERFVLVGPADAADAPPSARVVEALGDRRFHAQVAHLPGYDMASVGHVTVVEAA